MTNTTKFSEPTCPYVALFTTMFYRYECVILATCSLPMLHFSQLFFIDINV
jgi:hypothetical protein